MAQIFKLIPFQFNYNIDEIEELIKIVTDNTEIDYETITDKKVIGNISWCKSLWNKIFLSLEANYENNISKNVISNNSKKKEWEVNKWQTVTNDIIVFIDFWVKDKFEKFTDWDKNSKGLIFVIYNWAYAVTKNIMSYFEDILFKDKILLISNFHDNNQYLKDVKKYISWVKTDILYSTENKKGKPLKRKMWEFILSNSYINSEEHWIISSIDDIVDWSLEFFSEIRNKIETIPSVIIKWKKRQLVKDEKTQNYLVKNFPQEQEIPENGEKQILDIITKIAKWEDPDKEITKLNASMELIKTNLFK